MKRVLSHPLESFDDSRQKCNLCKKYFDKSEITNKLCEKCWSSIILTQSYGENNEPSTRQL